MNLYTEKISIFKALVSKNIIKSFIEFETNSTIQYQLIKDRNDWINCWLMFIFFKSLKWPQEFIRNSQMKLIINFEEENKEINFPPIKLLSGY